MTMTTTITRRLMALAFLTSFALLPACGDLGSARVDKIEYEPDGSLVVFMATGIHVLPPSLDRETMTIPFDGLPVNSEEWATTYSLSADGRVAAVSFSPPVGSTETSTITLFDMMTGARAQTFRLEDAAPAPDGAGITRRVSDLVLSPQADLIYVRSFIDSFEPNTFSARITVIDVASGAPLWTTDKRRGYPTFSADGTRLFVYSEENRIEALDPRTGATLYGVDVPAAGDVQRSLNGLALTADGTLASIIITPCADLTNCPPAAFASWSSADLTLLGERVGRPKTDAYYVANAFTLGAAFACSPWNGLCALGLTDVSESSRRSVVSIMQTDGTPLRELAVEPAANLMAFAPHAPLLTIVPIDVSGQTVQVFNVDEGTRVGSLSFDLDVP